MHLSPLVWVITCVVILGLFVFDFFAHVRTPHAPSFRESAFWSTVYIALAIFFGLLVIWIWGADYAGEYFAGYVTEKALSVDNLFVFVIIMGTFAVPREYQQKVLLIGIVMALVMRGIFIAIGAAAISAYSWVFYLFGAFLIYTAYTLIRNHGREKEAEVERDTKIISFAKKILPTTETYDGDKLVTRVDGKRMVTPLLLALIAIGFTDLIFALDSIPAIYGLTQEPYLVFTANAFALMGLRQLYFLIGGLLERLVYLSYGLSVILAFIGVKLLLHALHENTLGFVNGGESVAVPELSTAMSLVVIIGVLVVTTVASLVKTRNTEPAR
ncbi:tellurium resistance protein TerC [Rhodococcus sp. WMMA185]|uniref:TerC family protein n=1 Tax=Rhodococcus sp. WMMA185 TaxID=679318 RepID=UPI0008787617|nr:TerC family protein [Rhodococcus sp. WMMA185]AOW92426.1 tellurium resistance protein TerC [Rhodococcus sp. WMMA185]